METEYKVRLELLGWEKESERELEDLLEKHACNGEPDACDLEIETSISDYRPSIITFETNEEGVNWKQWLNTFLEAARDKAGKTCSGELCVTEIQTTEICYHGEAPKLDEYVVEVPTVHLVRKKVAAKNQSDAVLRVKKGEGTVLGETDTPVESSKWSVALYQPEQEPAVVSDDQEELAEAA
jgi:hypothetical protein